MGPTVVGPFGFDRIMFFFRIQFIFGTLRAKGTGSSLALALHYHEALSVPCASSPGSCSEESDSRSGHSSLYRDLGPVHFRNSVS